MSPSSIHNYRWRLGLAEGEPQYDESEAKLADVPDDRRADDHHGGRCQRRAASRARGLCEEFTGKYEHRLITGGIGHNLPQEAPQAFAQAVIDIART